MKLLKKLFSVFVTLTLFTVSISTTQQNVYADSNISVKSEVLQKDTSFLESSLKTIGNFFTGTVRIVITIVLIIGGIIALSFSPALGSTMIIIGVLVAMSNSIAVGVINNVGDKGGIFK